MNTTPPIVNNAVPTIAAPAVTSPTGAIYQIMEITPEMAEHWLGEFNTHNRHLRKHTVDAYANDMAAGKWQETGDAIRRATDGTIIDGQHRLAAIVKANVSVRMLVVSNLPMSTQEAVDTGNKRTFGDTLKLRKEAHYDCLAAVVRRVWNWERGDRFTAWSAVPSNAQLSGTLDRYPSLRKSAEVAAATARGSLIPASVLGLCHWLFNAIDSEDCEVFFDRLRDGANLPVGHPVYVLRKTVLDNRSASSTRLKEPVLGAYVIKAWNHYREGREIKVLQWRRGGANPEPFPEPK